MPVPTPVRAHSGRSSLRDLALAFLILALLPVSLFARGPQPSTRIYLEDLGFLPLSTRELLAGSSMLTLNYVDNTHVLLTFVVHRLIPRIPGDPPTDYDRIVEALLVEIPSGHVLARSDWQLHDQGRYLWDLGNGNFLLRIRDSFNLISPLANLHHGDPFVQTAFLRSSRHIVAVILSPDESFLTIESTDPIPLVDAPDPSQLPRRVQLNFYRVVRSASPGGGITLHDAGRALAGGFVVLPITSAGLLHVLDQGRQRWAFDFKSHSGKVSELSLYDSTCRPEPIFVSQSEFIVFGCHGGVVPQQLAGFNLRGEATWQMNLSGTYVAPSLDYAPTVSRFALGRSITNGYELSDLPNPSQFLAQIVDVYQNESGKVLLEIDCSPISRAGQNFAFSPDGMNLAVIREEAIEIFPLPPLTPQDRNAIKLAQDSAPKPEEGPVDLSSSTEGRRTGILAAQPDDDDSVLPASQPDLNVAPPLSVGQATPAPSSPAQSSPAQSSPAQPPPVQPADPPVHRKPPTLYNPDAPSPDQPPQSPSQPASQP